MRVLAAGNEARRDETWQARDSFAIWRFGGPISQHVLRACARISVVTQSLQAKAGSESMYASLLGMLGAQLHICLISDGPDAGK
jgi:hypothetical protein